MAASNFSDVLNSLHKAMDKLLHETHALSNAVEKSPDVNELIATVNTLKTQGKRTATLLAHAPYTFDGMITALGLVQTYLQATENEFQTEIVATIRARQAAQPAELDGALEAVQDARRIVDDKLEEGFDELHAMQGRPRNVVAVSGDGTITVTWDEPAVDDGVTGYTIHCTSSGDGQTVHKGKNERAATFSGLANGTAYKITVVANNAAGSSAPSPTISAIPHGVPGRPTNVQAAAGIDSVTVNWGPPGDDGGQSITGYRIVCNDMNGGQVSATANAGDRSTQIGNLQKGMRYSCSVQAKNNGEYGPQSEVVQVTVPDVPSPPRNVTAIPGDGQALIAWVAPISTGNSPITDYTVTCLSGPSNRVDRDLTTTTLLGLTNGNTYTVTVVANNAVGSSNPATVTVQLPQFSPTASDQSIIAALLSSSDAVAHDNAITASQFRDYLTNVVSVAFATLGDRGITLPDRDILQITDDWQQAMETLLLAKAPDDVDGQHQAIVDILTIHDRLEESFGAIADMVRQREPLPAFVRTL